MRDLIKEGDHVIVNINSVQLTISRKAEVMNVPCQSGGSWIFKDLESGAVHYVSEGCTVTLRKDSR